MFHLRLQLLCSSISTISEWLALAKNLSKMLIHKKKNNIEAIGKIRKNMFMDWVAYPTPPSSLHLQPCSAPLSPFSQAFLIFRASCQWSTWVHRRGPWKPRAGKNRMENIRIGIATGSGNWMKCTKAARSGHRMATKIKKQNSIETIFIKSHKTG